MLTWCTTQTLEQTSLAHCPCFQPFTYSSSLILGLWQCFYSVRLFPARQTNNNKKRCLFVSWVITKHAYIRRKERIYLLLTSLLFLLFRYAPGTFPDMLPSVFNIAIWESDIAHRLWCCSAGMEFVIALLADSCGSMHMAAHRRGMPSLWGLPPRQETSWATGTWCRGRCRTELYGLDSWSQFWSFPDLEHGALSTNTPYPLLLVYACVWSLNQTAQ